MATMALPWSRRVRYTRASKPGERASMHVSRWKSSAFVAILTVWSMADTIASARGRSAPRRFESAGGAEDVKRGRGHGASRVVTESRRRGEYTSSAGLRGSSAGSGSKTDWLRYYSINSINYICPRNYCPTRTLAWE